jgi:uncharacterized membrane protein
MLDLTVDFPRLLSVFGVAFFSLWASIPAGLALGLSPVPIIITAALSYASGVGLVAFLGAPLRDWLMRRFGQKVMGNTNSAVRRAWDRYGMIGLALLAPVTTGAQIGAAVGMAFNAPARRLFVWMSVGGLLWAVLLALAISLGIVGLQAVT